MRRINPAKRSYRSAALAFLLLVAGCLFHVEAAERAAKNTAQASLAEANRLRSEQLEASNLEAIAKYREAASLFRGAGELKLATTSLRNAGEILQLLGNTSEALACYKEAFALSNKTRDLLERGKIHNALAYLHFIAGNTKEAHQNSLAALSIGKKLRNREIEAEALSHLGEAFYALGQIERAREHQHRSLAMWRELNSSRGQALASIALGFYYRIMAQPENALRSYAEGLSAARRANDLGVETLALLAFGNFKRKLGDNQEALETYASAKLLADRIGDQTSQATILGGMASVHVELGDARKALQYMSEGTNLLERNGKKWGAAEGRLELGKILHALDEEELALQHLTEGLALFKTLGMVRMQSATLSALGNVYDDLGNTTKALDSHERALRLTRAGEDQREEAYILNSIGRIYEKLKKPDRALSYYRRALLLSRRAGDPTGESLTLYHLARAERDLGNLDEARTQIEAAFTIVESQRSKVAREDLRTSYFSTVRNFYDLYIEILMLQHVHKPHSGFDAEAFAVSEKARARSFFELLHEARVNVREGVDPALLAKEQQLNEALNTKAQLHVQLLSEKRKDEAANVNKELESLVDELASVRTQIRQASPNLATVELPELLTLKQVQQRVLDDETVLLEYALGDDRSYVWIVTRTASFSYELPPRAEIELSAKRLYNLITSAQIIYGEPAAVRRERQENAAERTPAETALLSKLILGPLAGKLNRKRLLVIADGTLQYIPFQMLTNPDSGNRLIDTHEIVNLPSASTLLLLKAEAADRKPARHSVAVLADPVFEVDDPRIKSGSNGERAAPTEVHQALRDVGVSPDGVQIPRLMASGAEADAIMQAAPWRSGLKAVGFEANRERVLSAELANYRIVHFATHGIINSERPELSGIVLSLFDSEGRSQNGFLRLHDIYNLHLPADLVVLSACSTGLGREVRGEGLIGLTRGFMYAGATGVIASLWKVDDDATAQLMKHFYDGLFKEGLSPAAALRKAQLALSQQKRWQSPYYWAGFVIQGQFTGNEKFTEPFRYRTQLLLIPAVVLLVIASLLFIRSKRRRNV